ncbi:hypothetical protein ROTAS13_02935 [Roseomonas sp. TAS13]|nr:hypothetical protein ROTAS13_02935 [Roseomonas sp. TAS13]
MPALAAKATGSSRPPITWSQAATQPLKRAGVISRRQEAASSGPISTTGERGRKRAAQSRMARRSSLPPSPCRTTGKGTTVQPS